MAEWQNRLRKFLTEQDTRQYSYIEISAPSLLDSRSF